MPALDVEEGGGVDGGGIGGFLGPRKADFEGGSAGDRYSQAFERDWSNDATKDALRRASSGVCNVLSKHHRPFGLVEAHRWEFEGCDVLGPIRASGVDSVFATFRRARPLEPHLLSLSSLGFSIAPLTSFGDLGRPHNVGRKFLNIPKCNFFEANRHPFQFISSVYKQVTFSPRTSRKHS